MIRQFAADAGGAFIFEVAQGPGRSTFRPADIDLHEGAGVAVQRVADLPGLKVTPFVRRAIDAHLLPVIARL